MLNVFSQKVKRTTGKEWKTINQSVVCKSKKEQVLIVEQKKSTQQTTCEPKTSSSKNSRTNNYNGRESKHITMHSNTHTHAAGDIQEKWNLACLTLVKH